MSKAAHMNLRAVLSAIPMIDTHSHVMGLQEMRRNSVNLFKIFGNTYARLDFISAGMSASVWEFNDNLENFWPLFKEYQPFVQHTAYYRATIRALQGLYGLKEETITDDNWQVLSERVTRAYQRNDWYHYVLKERANVNVGMLDMFWSVDYFCHDPSLFRPILRANPLILGRQYIYKFKGKAHYTSIEEIAQAFDGNLKTFEGYLDLVRTVIKGYKAVGSPAVKIATAYERTLEFLPVSRDEAAHLYVSEPQRLTPEEERRLQDFMARFVIGIAIEEGLPVQIHTGIFARNANILSNGNPEHLNQLFLDFPDARFVLLHFGFPYIGQAISLAKMFPNVFVDLVWVPLLSPTVARQVLDECLDLVAVNKIMWGSDAYQVEDVYAAACLAREVVTDVLLNKIERGEMNEEQALTIAQRIFYQNAMSLFRLNQDTKMVTGK
ncbi:amidohydrolase family protein [Acetomicrobium sp. S15 = DSM 107314]|uniref:amidohydrolase family protein n=1 Tax=Acetomicrobium sp. S15 = DSM 107314 TaxID=2529858 RepID=UPI0018E1173A|nr:amidohydrolase family protein [Acetomicrobium sp. S15 = DSM 107314]